MSMVVLVIEDEDDVREPNATALERAGYRVLQATSWESALTLSEPGSENVALIVTDLVMPDRAGVQVFAQLRGRYGPIPAIVLSAYPRVMRLLDGVLEGVVDWIQKPLEVSALVSAVDAALARTTTSDAGSGAR
jgi:two-component system OmpR family response regulator